MAGSKKLLNFNCLIVKEKPTALAYLTFIQSTELDTLALAAADNQERPKILGKINIR